MARAARIGHTCPGPGPCTRQVGWGRLLCRDHWCEVPRPLQRALYQEWRDGNPSAEHREVVRQVIESVQGQLIL